VVSDIESDFWTSRNKLTSKGNEILLICKYKHMQAVDKDPKIM
jgi:hypothetical protein